MSNRIIYLERRGLRGESYADILRRSGLFGVTPADSDEEAIAKLNSDAAASAALAEDAAIALAASENFYPDAAAGEAATVAGEAFSYADGNGGVALAMRTAAGHDVLDPPLSSRAVGTVADIAAMTLLPTADGRAVGLTTPDGGTFVFRAGDLSAAVAGDTLKVIHVAPASDPTGLTGAWVRQDVQQVSAKWFGAKGDGATDDTSAIQAALDYGDCTIPLGTYLVGSTIILPAGRTIRIAPGTRFIWTGAAPADSGLGISIFRMADDTQMICDGEFIGESLVYAPFLSVVAGFAVKNVTVLGAFGLDCTRSYFESTLGGTPYADVVTLAMKAAGDARPVNTNQNITIRGGGCSFPNHTPSGALGQPERAGDLIVYSEGWSVEDSRYDGCYCAVQWWGGDSGISPEHAAGGAPLTVDPDAERKCKDFRIHKLVGRRLGAGVWGSMGQDGVITGCDVEETGDVCYDAEGCIDIEFNGNRTKDAINGGLSTFSYSRGIRFINNRVISTKKEYVLARTYNISQSAENNKDVLYLGNEFVCTDQTGPGSVDTAFGPIEEVSFVSNKCRNVKVNFNVLNNNTVIVEGNQMHFPYRAGAGFIAISVGDMAGNFTRRALCRITDNTITGVTQPANTETIRAQFGNFNASARMEVERNSIEMNTDGGEGGIVLYNAGGNPGAVNGLFNATGNRLRGPIILSEHPGTTQYAVTTLNDNRDPIGNLISLTVQHRSA